MSSVDPIPIPCCLEMIDGVNYTDFVQHMHIFICVVLFRGHPLWQGFLSTSPACSCETCSASAYLEALDTCSVLSTIYTLDIAEFSLALKMWTLLLQRYRPCGISWASLWAVEI